MTQPDAREGQAGPPGVSERSIVPAKPSNIGGGKGPWFKVNVTAADSREIGVSLLPPAKVGKLQAALHAKAKSAPTYRFYALYDKMYRLDVLTFAYACCRANQGAAGVDGQTFEDIEAYGWERWVGELAEALGERGLSHRGPPRMLSAPSVAGAAGASAGDESVTLLGAIPAPHLRAGEAGRPTASVLVCERMSPCPRAGCGKPARPVR